MKSFVREHWRAIVIITSVGYAAAVLAGGSVVVAYAALIACMAIWLWRLLGKEELS
jgi:hypothetical protein